jgi:CIC family chloride channel protein
MAFLTGERLMVRNRDGDSERLRVPPPFIKRRIASGRGAMEQPNVTADGATRITLQFWIAVVLTGIATGLFGDFLMWILKVAEHQAFHYSSGSYQNSVAAVSKVRRVVSLLVASAIGAVSWYLIRRYLKREKSEIDDALWNGDGELSLRRSLLTSLVSEVVIGLGASIGREAAPKLMGGASGSVVSHWFKLTPAQKRLLVACGGGAGLAAVYNVPLGGAIFTAEVLYGSFALPVVMPALATSLIATMVAWLYLPSGATYVDIPSYRFTGSLMVWSIVAGGVIGLLAVFYVRLIGWVSTYRARGVSIFWMMPLAFVIVGVIGMWYPQLFGNGKDMAHEAFLGVGGLGLLFALFALKPFVTALTLGSGAAGGVFTPFLATGAVLGAFLGAVWIRMWPGTPIGAFALVGAAAMIGASMQAPIAGLVLVMELTHNGFSLMIPMMAATSIATYLVRQIDGYSIYSARLPRHEPAHEVDGPLTL